MRLDAVTHLANDAGEDRVAVVPVPEGVVLVVADGAGGSGGGAAAAQWVVDRATSASVGLREAEDVSALLAEIDRHLAERNEGQSTAVVVVLAGRRVVGASVGDSQALLFTDTGHLALTSAQVRKPLLGSGRARPTGFEAPVDGGRLLIATDGLFNHASMDGIRRVILGAALPTVGPALVQLARLASGALPDDVGLVVVHLDVGARGGPGLTTQ